jgi:hypothetical protein
MGNRLEVKVDGNTSGFKHAMDTVRTQAKATASEITHSWTGAFTGGILGAMSFVGVKSMVDSFISNAKGIKDMAEQLDMSAEATQKWAKAADDVGQSMQGVYSVISAIQSKRQEALRDPGAADYFSALDINRQEVLNDDVSTLVKRVLQAGGESDEKRKVVEQIVGRRGLRMIPAASKVDQETPDFGPDAMKAADEADKAGKRASYAIGRMVGNVFAWIFSSVDDSTQKANEDEKQILAGKQKGGLLWRFLHRNDKSATGAMGDGKASAPLTPGSPEWQAAKQKQFMDQYNSPSAASQGSDDPLIGIKNQQDKDFELRKEEAQLSLHEAERRNMTIAARKKSIKQDLDLMNKEISEREKAQKEGRIYGMTIEQQKDLFKTDIKNKLQADQLALIDLHGKAAGLTGELRNSKGFNFSADSLARVGLYSSSTVQINPILELTKRQISILQRIEHNTGIDHDPHRR